jgi:hypothetical protein
MKAKMHPRTHKSHETLPTAPSSPKFTLLNTVGRYDNHLDIKGFWQPITASTVVDFSIAS